ncbi:MAG: hypothetical protein AABZ06_13745 [Bdellovibrionota bacterium]
MIKLYKSRIVYIAGGLGVVALIGFDIFSNSFAAPVPRARSIRAGRQEIRKEERKRASESLRGEARMVEAASKLGLHERELSEFFKDSRLGLEAKAVWSKLLREISVTKTSAKAIDFHSAELLADTLSSFIQLRRSGLVGDFHIEATDLLAMHKSWTLEQRTNFGRALRRSVEISREGRAVSLEEAFEKALDELGYLEEYRLGCGR